MTINNDSHSEPLLNENADKQGKTKLDTLTRTQIIGYGLGHFQNDLCAACWFNYILYFMKSVVFGNDPNSGFYAGIVLLSGQITDGLATPLVGYFSDKYDTKIGKRMPWYLFGFILVSICFIFVFQQCLFCEWFDNQDQWLLIFYYVFFPSAFNIGWAAVQVSHMSLVPSLTLSRKQRDKLNNFRNTFTYIANLFVLVLAFIVFLTLKCGFTQFKVLSLVSLGVGFLTSIFFICTVNEKKITQDCRMLKREIKYQMKYSLDSEAGLSPRKVAPSSMPKSKILDESRPKVCHLNGNTDKDRTKSNDFNMLEDSQPNPCTLNDNQPKICTLNDAQPKACTLNDNQPKVCTLNGTDATSRESPKLVDDTEPKACTLNQSTHVPAISTLANLKATEDMQSPLTPQSASIVGGNQSDYEKWELSDDEETGKIRLSKRKKSKHISSSIADEIVDWKQWFKVSAFYIYGFVYMAVRLLVNVQSSLIIFYLQNVLEIAPGKDNFDSGLPVEFAIIPIIIYASSTVISMFLKTIYMKIGRKKTFTIGGFAAILGSAIMMYLTPQTQAYIYAVAVILGIGQSICLNTGISLIGEVIGVKGSSGAFVFGSYSLLDKFANGIILYLVINLRDVGKLENAEYIRNCTSIIPAVSVVFAWILIMIGKAADYDAGDVVMENKKEYTSSLKDNEERS